MKLYREYEEIMLKIMGILGAITIGVLLITVAAKFALDILIWGVVISAILLGAGGVYLGICVLIDFDERFGLK